MTLIVATPERLKDVAKGRWFAETEFGKRLKWESVAARDIATWHSKSAYDSAVKAIDVICMTGTSNPRLSELVLKYRDAWLAAVQLWLARSNSPEARAAAFSKMSESVGPQFKALTESLVNASPKESWESLLQDALSKVSEAASYALSLLLARVTADQSAFQIAYRKCLRAKLNEIEEGIELKKLSPMEQASVNKDVAKELEDKHGCLFRGYGRALDVFGYALLAISTMIAVWAASQNAQQRAYEVSKSLLESAAGVVGGQIGDRLLALGTVNNFITEFVFDAATVALEAAEETAAALSGLVTFGIGFVVGTVAGTALTFTIDSIWSALFEGRPIPRSLRVGIYALLSMNTIATIVAPITSTIKYGND